MYLLSTVVASLAVFFFLKWMKKRRYCTDVKRLDGKTVLITGAGSGVGKETAVALAARGARVVVACRDADKAEKAVREIKSRSRSLAVVGMELDLASLRSVRRFCESFLRREERLDVLINNAAMPGVLDWTEDGFSMCLGVNHLGHFLLTNLLLGRLKECAPSRVLTLTCSSYKYQKLDLQDLNYNLLPFFTYCRSKLANVYFSHELGRLARGKGVTSFAVHPGLVRSEWTRHYSLVFRAAARVLTWMFSASCEAGAQTVVYCAVSDEAARRGAATSRTAGPPPCDPSPVTPAWPRSCGRPARGSSNRRDNFSRSDVKLRAVRPLTASSVGEAGSVLDRVPARSESAPINSDFPLEQSVKLSSV